MSFDAFLQRFADGERAEANRAGVMAVLDRTDHRGPDEFGFFIVKTSDGHEVEFSASGLDGSEPFESCAFHLRGLSQRVSNLIYSVAESGEMVILHSSEDAVVYVFTDETIVHLPADLTDSFTPVVIRSPAELHAGLAGGFDGWSNYRDRVFPRK
ncbi:MAG: hypothetical protein AAF432_06310 [Planctomycetota bacterium]